MMDSRQHQRRVLELLDETLERPSAERAAFLTDACRDDDRLRRDVEALLEPENEAGILDAPAFSIHAPDAGIGRRIGPYHLVQLLDRGGMGTVYLAEREDFEQQVALKLIRRGLDGDDVFVRRFHNERQILARLGHPGIARLLDGGTTEDQLPYFVMELVEGEPIDRYCANHRLSIGQRLRLFRQVCLAVQFAHQNLVVHRDLKPGNILITPDGEPKLLDFGIAKLLDDGLAAETLATAPGQGPMTPRYASPEQIRLEPITTASDVYSLGVLLYELLTGVDPYHLDTDRSDEVARAICEKEPTRPSTAVRRRAKEPSGQVVEIEPRKLGRRLSGDLDSIVLKALRKEPGERYASVEQLSADIERHRVGEPVHARTGTFSYRAGKFVRRNRAMLAVAVGFAVLVSALGAVLGQAINEREKTLLETERADLQGDKVEAASKLFSDVFKTAEPDKTRGDTLTVLRLLEIGEGQIETARKPEVKMFLAGLLGQVFFELGSYERSQVLMEQALERTAAHYGEHPELAKRVNNLAVLFYENEDYPQAEVRFREALDLRLRLRQPESALSRAKNNLASVLMLQGKFEEAEALYREVLELRLLRDGKDDRDVATSTRSLAALNYARGDLASAEELARESLRVRKDFYGPEHLRVAATQNLLGEILTEQKRSSEAERLFNTALATRRELRDDNHLIVAKTRRDLARLLIVRDPSKAHRLLTQALDTFRNHRPDGWDAAYTESLLGEILVNQADYEAAESYLIPSYDRLKAIRGEQTLKTRQACKRIIELYTRWDKLDHPNPCQASEESTEQEGSGGS